MAVVESLLGQRNGGRLLHGLGISRHGAAIKGLLLVRIGGQHGVWLILGGGIAGGGIHGYFVLVVCSMPYGLLLFFFFFFFSRCGLGMRA